MTQLNPELYAVDGKQRYCVAAEDRGDGKRKAITSPMDFASAEICKNAYKKSSSLKKLYKYFHVAKFPYKTHSNHPIPQP